MTDVICSIMGETMRFRFASFAAAWRWATRYDVKGMVVEVARANLSVTENVFMDKGPAPKVHSVHEDGIGELA